MHNCRLINREGKRKGEMEKKRGGSPGRAVAKEGRQYWGGGYGGGVVVVK